MNLLCSIFGHQPPSASKAVGGEYMVLKGLYADGTGRIHALNVSGYCPRCDARYTVGKTHIPTIEVTKLMEVRQK